MSDVGGGPIGGTGHIRNPAKFKPKQMKLGAQNGMTNKLAFTNNMDKRIAKQTAKGNTAKVSFLQNKKDTRLAKAATPLRPKNMGM